MYIYSVCIFRLAFRPWLSSSVKKNMGKSKSQVSSRLSTPYYGDNSAIQTISTSSA